MKKIHLLLITSLLIVGSCGKEKISAHQDFEGYWEGEDLLTWHEIEIQPTGSATYIRQSGITTFTATGQFKIKPGKYIKIGLKKFTLDEYPSFDGTDWTMRIDGVEYFRY